MSISNADIESIFRHEVATSQLSGTVSTGALRAGFGRIKERMHAHGATENDLRNLRERIERAIDNYSWRESQHDQREAARDALHSAFDGIVRASQVQVVSGLFLRKVEFRGSDEAPNPVD
jgi:hypothetical protein